MLLAIPVLDANIAHSDRQHAILVRAIRRGNHDLLVVGSSPGRGTLRTYMLGDLSRDIVGRAGRAFLVLRSRPPGLLTEIWRSLKEGAAEGSAESAESNDRSGEPRRGDPVPEPRVRAARRDASE
jgi:hypothetical protein